MRGNGRGNMNTSISRQRRRLRGHIGACSIALDDVKSTISTPSHAGHWLVSHLGHTCDFIQFGARPNISLQSYVPRLSNLLCSWAYILYTRARWVYVISRSCYDVINELMILSSLEATPSYLYNPPCPHVLNVGCGCTYISYIKSKWICAISRSRCEANDELTVIPVWKPSPVFLQSLIPRLRNLVYGCMYIFHIRAKRVWDISLSRCQAIDELVLPSILGATDAYLYNYWFLVSRICGIAVDIYI